MIPKKAFNPTVALYILAAALGTAISFAQFGKGFSVPLTILPVATTFFLLIVTLTVVGSILSPIVSSCITIIFLTILQFASYKKFTLTGEPVVYSDISNTNNVIMAARYINIYGFLFFVFCLFLSTLYFAIKSNSQKSKRSHILSASCVALTLFISVSPSVPKWLFIKFHEYGPTYFNWNWPHNESANGLLIHILQTSERPSPASISEADRTEFLKLFVNTHVGEQAAQRLILILCESCWYDSEHFSDVFAPLLSLGGREMRGVSPVFGGGTPNATFEIISGLPVNGPSVSGVVYQEYRDLFSSKTSTIASHLRDHGYRTLSAHNFRSDFWFRSTVEPKLGFQQFHGAEEMIPEWDGNSFPSDSHLFDFAAQAMKDNPDRLFMHLATVHTHGPFTDDNHYRQKASETVRDIGHFIKYIQKTEPDTVVIIYGDHKPALESLLFYLHQPRPQVGDVPVIVFDQDIARLNDFQSSIDKKPFYCIAISISSVYFSMDLPVSHFTSDICENYMPEEYDLMSGVIPSWFYSAALFDKILDNHHLFSSIATSGDKDYPLDKRK